MATLSRAQKAAALVLAMGPEAAGVIFEHMKSNEVEAVVREVAALDRVERDAVAEIVREFFDDLAARRKVVIGGPDMAKEIIRSWQGPKPDSDDEVERVLGFDADRPFFFLRDYPHTQIANVLGDEHPQTAALVLAYLPAKMAAQVLATFEPTVQHDVSMRIATLASVAPPVIRSIEEAMRSRLGKPRAAATGMTSGGEREVASILNGLDRKLSDEIMENIAKSDPDLADRIREQMFVFEDIIILDNRAIQEVLRSVEPIKLATAMKGASEEVTDAIWRNLSERASTALQEELELLGKVPRKDVEEARTEVVRNVQRLADEGTITISRGGSEDFIE